VNPPDVRRQGVRPGENPFRSSCIDAIPYHACDHDAAAVIAKWKADGRRGAIVGPHGSGKSTLMREVAAALEAAGEHVVRRTLRQDQPSPSWRELRDELARATPDGVVIFDGADALSRLMWMRYRHRSRRAGGLIITTHRAGLLPTLVTTRTSPELVDVLLQHLLPHASVAVHVDAHARLDVHHGNVREVWRDLYDRFAAGEFTH